LCHLTEDDNDKSFNMHTIKKNTEETGAALTASVPKTRTNNSTNSNNNTISFNLYWHNEKWEKNKILIIALFSLIQKRH